MRLTRAKDQKVSLLPVNWLLIVIVINLFLSTVTSSSIEGKKINLNSKNKPNSSSKHPPPPPPHHAISSSASAPSSISPNPIQDSVIKVAGQLLASDSPASSSSSSSSSPGQFTDKSFPSCPLGWESNPSLVHYDLISGHYLIDTPYRVTDDLEPSICIRDCTRDPDCKSLNIDYKRGTCEFIQARVRESPLIDSTRLPTQFNLLKRNNLRPSPGQNYFEKICLNSTLCPAKDWSFERVKSSKLSPATFDGKVSNYNLTIIEAVISREVCLTLCLNETKFTCRAAIYDQSGHFCWLSSVNRFSSPEIKLERALNFEYFESNCASEARGFCNTKGAKDQKQLLSERILFTSTLEECQSECILSSSSSSSYSTSTSSGGPIWSGHGHGHGSHFNWTAVHVNSYLPGLKKPSDTQHLLHPHAPSKQHPSSSSSSSSSSASTTGFICRSFSYEASSHTCSLSHHSSRTSLPSLIRSPGYVYFELASCFDVQVDCAPESMVVSVRSSNIFNGKMYPRDTPAVKHCNLDITSSSDFTLALPLTNSSCGTVQESEGEFTNVLVIQAHDAIVTSFDKAIGVKCTFDVGNRTIGQTNLTINEISFEKKVKSKASLPPVTLHITDRMGREKDSFALGEVLKVQVKLANESVYGIFVRNIIASNGQKDHVTLIDRHGCPSEGKLMKEVRLLDESSKSLESSFEAFSFTGSNYLTLQAEVETCLDICKPVHCNSFARLEDGDEVQSGPRHGDDDNGTVLSYGRRRRSVTSSPASVEGSKGKIGPIDLALSPGKSTYLTGETNQANNGQSNWYLVDQFDQLTHETTYPGPGRKNRQRRSQVHQPHPRPGDVLAIQKVAKQIRLITPTDAVGDDNDGQQPGASSSEIELLQSTNDVHEGPIVKVAPSKSKHHAKQSQAQTKITSASLTSVTWIVFGIGLMALFVLQITCGFVVCTLRSSKSSSEKRVANATRRINSTSSWPSSSEFGSISGTLSNSSVMSSSFSSISSYSPSESIVECNSSTNNKFVKSVTNFTGKIDHQSKPNHAHRSHQQQFNHSHHLVNGKSNLFNLPVDDNYFNQHSNQANKLINQPEKVMRMQL